MRIWPWSELRRLRADNERLREQARHRVQIERALGRPTTCRVWRDDALVFVGQDMTASMGRRS